MITCVPANPLDPDGTRSYKTIIIGTRLTRCDAVSIIEGFGTLWILTNRASSLDDLEVQDGMFL